MPEGDAVRRTARRLDRALSGDSLVRTDFRVPSLATVDLSGGRVIETVARGKHLLTHVDHDSGPVTIHSHLRMDGAWRFVSPGDRWPCPAHQVRVVLTTERSEALGVLLGELDVWPRSEDADLLDHLGPDLLADDWDEDEALRRLRATPDVAVFVAIRDQRCLAGIGTIYAAEGCFVQGIHPLTPVGDVSDLSRLLRRVRSMMHQEWSRSRRLWVYRRRSCRRCRGPIELIPVGPPGQQRSAYLCPHCQP